MLTRLLAGPEVPLEEPLMAKAYALEVGEDVLIQIILLSSLSVCSSCQLSFLRQTLHGFCTCVRVSIVDQVV